MQLTFISHPPKTELDRRIYLSYTVNNEEGELLADDEPHNAKPFDHDLCQELGRRNNLHYQLLAAYRAACTFIDSYTTTPDLTIDRINHYREFNFRRRELEKSGELK